MSELVRIEAVEPLDGHWLRLWFKNGGVKDVDLSEALAGGGVFEPIYSDRAVFEQVRVNPETRTIEWPGGCRPRSRRALRELEPEENIQAHSRQGASRLES